MVFRFGAAAWPLLLNLRDAFLCFMCGARRLRLAAGCIATSTIEFDPEENFPPSIVSQPNAEYPLDEIGQLNLDDPGSESRRAAARGDHPGSERRPDPRVSDLSRLAAASRGRASDHRARSSRRASSSDRGPYDVLRRARSRRCHKIELVVVGQFASFVEPRRPAEEGDFDKRPGGSKSPTRPSRDRGGVPMRAVWLLVALAVAGCSFESPDVPTIENSCGGRRELSAGSVRWQHLHR